MKFEKYIRTILPTTIIAGVIAVITSGLGYINKLEDQIEERDSLISRLAISDNLVREYFDVSIDSLTNNMIYTLKPSKLEQVRITQDGYHKIFKAGDDVLTIDEIVDKYNTNLKDYISLVDKYNQLIGHYNDIANQMHDSYILKEVLKLIDEQYGIKYEIQTDSTSYRIILPPSPKIDSALMLLPHYRENLKYDKKTDRWMIIKQVVEKRKFL
jgi:hypothetical protein